MKLSEWFSALLTSPRRSKRQRRHLQPDRGGQKTSAEILECRTLLAAEISISAVSSVSEGQNVSFEVTLSEPAANTVTVDYSTAESDAPSAATSGSDFTAKLNQNLSFSAGQTRKTITVATINDSQAEFAETFDVVLSNASGAAIANGRATATINDDDGALRTVSIADAAAVTEGQNAVFTVSLSEAAASSVSVQYSTASGSGPEAASNGVDLTAANNTTLTFSPGETEKTIRIATLNDQEVEGDEVFTVSLTSPNGVTIGDREATGTINDNDSGGGGLPILSINNAPPVTEGGTSVFTVTLTSAATTNVTVEYSTFEDNRPTAAGTSDFTSKTNQTLTFVAGELQRTISVVTTDDSEAEGTETFGVRLTNPSGATLATAEAIGTISDDEVAVPAFSVGNAAAVTEGSNATFTVSLSRAATSALTVEYSTANATGPSGATSDSDFTAISNQTLTFAAGETQKTVTVATTDDDQIEPPEEFQLVLSNPSSGSRIAARQAIGTINDNDSPVEFQILSPLGVIANQQPTFTWTPIAGAVSYDFELILVGSNDGPLIQTTVSGTSFDTPSVLGIGRYRTWVRATVAGGAKTQWMSDAFGINATTTIHAIEFHGTDRTPTFTWDAVAGATQYRVFLSNRTTGGDAIVDQQVSGTSFTPTSDLGFGRYLIWVRPVGLNGFEAAWSSSEDYYIGPTLLGPSGSILDSQPQFSWTTIPGAATYHLFVTGPGGVLINTPGLTSNSFTPNSPLPDGDFRWWIKPSTADGAGGAWSLPTLFSTGGRTKVTSHSGTITDSIPEFTWPAVQGAQSYEIYVSKIGTPGALYRQAGLNGTSYPSQALDNGDYKVWIRTVQSDGRLVWGSGVAFTVAKTNSTLQTTPLAPTSPGFDTTPQFRWLATPGAVGYDIYLHDGNNASLQSNLTGTSWTPSTALASGDWTWRIRPRSSGGATGAWSTSSSFSTSGRTVLLSPGASTNDRTPTFTWQAVSDANRYILQVNNLTTSTTRVIREDDISGTSFTPTTALAAGTYRVWVRAVSSGGISPWSHQVDFVVT